MSFVHLGVRSEYAIVDSIVRIKELVAKASQDGQTSLALADLSNTFALVKFYHIPRRNFCRSLKDLGLAVRRA